MYDILIIYTYTYIYIYVIFTPNLGLRITVFVREREQDRFRRSTGGARESKVAQQGSNVEYRRSEREREGAL